ncbi:hypothetical protein HU200_051483 [Digitaria exilis]|uniref:Uncharacterized protein n=1 Tax=Digitaria exilis TaxID=1010633 RepID=A0A835ASS3_9POAL|nr:hypothetical protein HU200_051483 [Digitaria exilis]
MLQWNAYTLTLCREDVTNTSTYDPCQLCAYDKDTFVLYDACYLRFCNHNFIASATDSGDPLILLNSQNASLPVNVFDTIVHALCILFSPEPRRCGCLHRCCCHGAAGYAFCAN